MIWRYSLHGLVDVLEPRLERLLRLDPKPFGLREVAEIASLPTPAQRFERRYFHYMDRPRRGRILDWVLLKLRRVGDENYGVRRAWWRMRGRLDVWRAARQLSEARELHFGSSYIHPAGDNLVEGHFSWGGDLRWSLTIYAGGYFPLMAESGWQTDEFLGGARSYYQPPCEPWQEGVVVPGDQLNDELIKEALTRWYAERYRWKRGHWTWREKRQPTIHVDLSWGPSIEELQAGSEEKGGAG